MNFGLQTCTFFSTQVLDYIQCSECDQYPMHTLPGRAPFLPSSNPNIRSPSLSRCKHPLVAHMLWVSPLKSRDWLPQSPWGTPDLPRVVRASRPPDFVVYRNGGRPFFTSWVSTSAGLLLSLVAARRCVLRGSVSAGVLSVKPFPSHCRIPCLSGVA
jgi:hypothetical protein